MVEPSTPPRLVPTRMPTPPVRSAPVSFEVQVSLVSPSTVAVVIEPLTITLRVCSSRMGMVSLRTCLLLTCMLIVPWLTLTVTGSRLSVRTVRAPWLVPLPRLPIVAVAS